MSTDIQPADGLFIEQSPRLSPAKNWSQVIRAFQEPGHAFTVLLAVIRGMVFTWWVHAFRPRIQVGRGLRIYGRLSIQGPGTVVLGDDVQIYGRVTPWTNATGARIEIGDRTKLDGTRVSCVCLVRIGRDCLVANCRILDSSFHSIRRSSGSAPAPVLEAPVEIGDNVWVSPDAGLLPGTRIGNDSVVAMAAICKGEFPSGVMILGNPARVAGRIP